MVNDADVQYVERNLQSAERMLIFLEDRRLLRDRLIEEDYEECRLSAHELRKILEAEMLAVRGKGFLLDALRDMQKSCRTFVEAAGKNSEYFRQDHSLFLQHLEILRIVFAQRVHIIVERFDLTPTAEIQNLLSRIRS